MNQPLNHRELANNLEKLTNPYIQDLLEVLGLLPTASRAEGVDKVKAFAKEQPGAFLERVAGSGYDDLLLD